MNTMNLRHRLVRTLAGSAALLGGLASGARAGELAPGSLLLFPEFEAAAGANYLITVTNLHPTQSITTHWTYVEGKSCTEFDRFHFLTPNDTLTLIVAVDNPEQDAGFLFVTAVDPNATQSAVSFNRLVGTATRIDGIAAFAYTVDPFTFEALAPELAPTDVDADGLQDFDGIEYSTVPDEMLVPRFLGQTSSVESDLVLLNLSGTVQFDAVVDFLVYNDNEEAFSAQYAFHCWERVGLLEISSVFDQQFLHDFTNHDPDEVLGAPATESGWFRIDGNIASSSTQTIEDPAILAFLSERSSSSGQTAELPFGLGSQANGALFDFSSSSAPKGPPGPFAPRH